MGTRVQCGEMYTVTAHQLPHGPHDGGGWHCRATGDVQDGKVVVQLMKLAGDRWKPSMSTSVYAAALIPLQVQVDLFGNPTPPPARRAHGVTAGATR